MSNISVSINVEKVNKDRFYQGKKGKYMNLVLIPTPDSEYGDDYMVVQDLGREAREAGEKGPVLGNAKFFGKGKKQDNDQDSDPF